MQSLNVDKIADHIIPKTYDSYIGINHNSSTSNLNYSYFYHRDNSSLRFYSERNPSVKYIHNIIEKSLEIKFDMNWPIDNVQSSLIYKPYLLHNITFVQQFLNLYKTKHFSIPIFKFEIDSTNGMNFLLKNKIRPFAEQKKSKFLKINIENSYAASILCSNIHFIFPSLAFSLFTNTKQSIFLMKTKFDQYINLLSCFSFVFDHNKFVTFLPEFCLIDSCKSLLSFSKKYQSLFNVCIEKDKLGVKYDSENKYFLLRYENLIKTKKGNMVDCGLSISYRFNTFRTASAVKYTTNDLKWSFLLGKTEDTKLSSKISYLFNEDIQIAGGFCIGPIPTKYPSKSFCFEFNFFNNEDTV